MSDDTYTVERSTMIAASRERIYAQLVDFRNWRAWSPWEGLDPELQCTYAGASVGTGAVYGWSGNRKAGQGRMEITDATEPSRVEVELRFDRPFKSQSRTVFTIAPQHVGTDDADPDDNDGAGSLVTWTMTGRKTGMARVMGLVVSMDRLLGKEFERGLAQLKATAESPSAA